MNKISLNNLELKTFTEQDALDYCQINNINSNDITVLDLYDNKLTDISGVKIFKNLKILWISGNNISDISVLKYLNRLEFLNIDNLRLESDQVQYINFLKNLEELRCKKGFKDMSVINKLNKNINIIK